MLAQLGGACLLGLGIWVIVDPTGFREIVAANPLLLTGAYTLLAMGGLLFLLGFLGCCGAVRENKCLLLFVSASASPLGAGVAGIGGKYTVGVRVVLGTCTYSRAPRLACKMEKTSASGLGESPTCNEQKPGTPIV